MDPSAADSGKPDRSAAGPTDGALVQQALHGQKEAFNQLITRYQRQALAVSYRLLNNSHDAAEVSQDAFVKAYKSLGTLEKAEAFGGWLMRIVSNLSLNYRRSRKTRQQLPLDDMLTGGNAETSGGSEWSSKSADPQRLMESAELGQKLQQALAELPEKQRMAILLFTIEQLPQKQVAEALECSVEAVKWHVFQGRKKLKTLLKDHI
jgi:RNA polymerase sigma-70 factor (ECF subfamily)